MLAVSAEALLARHATLRLAFSQLESGDIRLVASPRVELPWRDVDLCRSPEDEALAAARRVAEGERARRFDLATPPLLRFVLVRLASDRHQLILTHHHILLDGWSMPVLLRELLATYAADGDTSGLPPVTPYREYGRWLARQDRDAAKATWAAPLSGLEEGVLVAPRDTSRASVIPSEVVVDLDEPVGTGLREYARRHDLTLNSVVQGAWALLVGQLSGRADVVFGVTAAGRPAELPGAETMLGLFINTVPARAWLDPRQSVAGMLAALQDQQSGLIEHQHLSLADIQRLAGLAELFDTLLLVYQNFPVGLGRRAPRGRGQLRRGDGCSPLPAQLVVFPGDRLKLLVYRPDLFDAGTAELIVARLVRVLEQVAAGPGRRLGELELLGAVSGGGWWGSGTRRARRCPMRRWRACSRSRCGGRRMPPR